MYMTWILPHTGGWVNGSHQAPTYMYLWPQRGPAVTERPTANKKPTGPTEKQRTMGPIVNKRPMGPTASERPTEAKNIAQTHTHAYPHHLTHLHSITYLHALTHTITHSLIHSFTLTHMHTHVHDDDCHSTSWNMMLSVVQVSPCLP